MRRTLLATLACLCWIGLANGDEANAPEQPQVRMIGATTMVTEVTTGVPLPARVDTGATSCSIHCETFEIKDEHPDPKDWRTHIFYPVDLSKRME